MCENLYDATECTNEEHFKEFWLKYLMSGDDCAIHESPRPCQHCKDDANDPRKGE